ACPTARRPTTGNPRPQPTARTTLVWREISRVAAGRRCQQIEKTAGRRSPDTRLTGTARMQHFISSYGYLAILLLMTAESACIPVPSELTMPFGGAIAAGAVAGVHLNLALVIVAGVAGNVIGS